MNVAQAGDHTKGTRTVSIDGNPTALEGVSEISTSMGDEAGTQGGNLISHKTKGKGMFSSWSFSVKAEGKGVACHGDQVGQNGMSGPVGVVDAAAITRIASSPYAAMLKDAGKPCPPGTKTPPTDTTQAQRDSVNQPTSRCWACGNTSNSGRYKSGKKYDKNFIADHEPPQGQVWKFLGGCHNKALFEQWKHDVNSVQPHCHVHSTGQSQAVKEPESVLEFMALAWP